MRHHLPLIRIGQRTVSTLALASLFATAGCSVLTEQQVQAVARFATATKSYEELPGAIIEGHSDLRMRRKILDAETRAQVAGDVIAAAITVDADFRDRATKVNAALEVLGSYSDLLEKLTSDDFTTALEASAEGLANEVDGALDAYKKAGGSTPDSLGSLGSMAAALVRGAGGWFIRTRQLRMLREAVVTADPIVAAVTDQIGVILVMYTGKGGLVLHEAADLGKWLTEVEPLVNAELRSDARRRATDLFREADGLNRLSDRAHTAAQMYRDAHAALAKAVQGTDATDTQQARLQTASLQVRAIASELKAARSLYSRLNKN